MRRRPVSRAVGAALVCIVIGTGAVRAQAVSDTRSAVLLTLPASARALALGDGWGAMADDESALFYQPAQIARVLGLAAGGSLQHYLAGTTLAAMAATTRLWHGTIGGGVRILDYGSAPEFAFSGVQEGTATGRTISAQDVAVTVGYAASWGDGRVWRAGAALTSVRQRVADVSGSSVALDLGVAHGISNGWQVSAALQNAGQPLALAGVRAPLPLTWRAAAATPARIVARNARLRARVLGELRNVSGAGTTGVLGSELTWVTPRAGLGLAARAAIATHHSGDARSSLTAGGGLSLGRLTVDYAYEGFAVLGATHRVGLRVTAVRR